MPISTIAEALADIKEGKIIILVDDEDRENEGDFMVAAEKVTPEIINFKWSPGIQPNTVPLLRCPSRQKKV